ncbi:MAG TPA: penicillin-binding transpeptidase domain-containing protein [Candidatus Paceibacterota bacterium]|nr:penicillin-binding transpeptidase domain-containing protein [Candidatus Paceibacterota bacterium]
MRWRFKKRKRVEINPDEILLDSQNPSDFDRDRFEGRIERPLTRRSFFFVGTLLAVLTLLLVGRAGQLQIAQGATFAKEANDNQLEQKVIVADRGEIVDRNGTPLAYNERANVTDEFAQRVYSAFRGVSNLVGYVKPPAKDSSGTYYRDVFQGMDGVEEAYNGALGGTNGEKLSETNARGQVVSESVENPPVSGQKITLSIDAGVTQGLYDTIAGIAQQSGFHGAAGIVMNVQTGEILAMTTYPEYSSQSLTDGNATAINSYNANQDLPFLNRAVDGLYSPGSIVKPVMAIAGLTEGVITPDTHIVSTGSISVPNPYDPKHPSVFKDWRVNGDMTVRDALAVSSDVFFYEVGGGFQNQPGIGIDKIDKYLQMFGFGTTTGLAGFTEPKGVVSSIAWKAANFPGDQWRLGDTYHTAIGQYGTQITPLQAVREAAAIASGGKLLTPTLIASSTPKFTQLNLPAQNFEVTREGMREGVVSGIAGAVKFDYVHIAAKTGTAQVGVNNEYQNSWMIGFWPYENPKYAYAIVMEKGPSGTTIESPTAAGQFFQWLEANDPQYLQ